MDMEQVKALDNVKAYHLKVEFDKKNDILVYDRKIQPGNGPPIYGLEVCKAMDLTTISSDGRQNQEKTLEDEICSR